MSESSAIECVISVDKDEIGPEQLERLEELVGDGGVEDYESEKALLRDLRDTAPGTTLCSGAEVVGIVSGAITIYTFSRGRVDDLREWFDENDVEWTEITDGIVSEPSDSESK